MLCVVAMLGCMFHTGVIRVVPPAGAEGGHRQPLSEDEIRTILDVVGDVAKSKGFDTKRTMSMPFGPRVLVYYYSPEQISISVWLARKSASIGVQIRDVNHTTVTPFTESIRSEITEKVGARLPQHAIAYEVP